MKKVMVSFLLLFINITLYAQETNYTSEQECINDVAALAGKAANKNQSSLTHWFTSFAHDTDGKIDYWEGTVTYYGGCRIISWNSPELWRKMREKLDQQISQSNAGQSSLYGDRATLICKYSDVTHHIIPETCK